MSSLLPGYEYDIFISYRHNDNRSGWVTEFVKALLEELAATIKDPVSVYFDTNPHDGLLETHNVDKSLEGKLKCLIFIPIISQTYCDPKSFAWQYEFCAFNSRAKEDRLGVNIKLINGNVTSRILPVRIHDLDQTDLNLLNSQIGGVLRSVDLIYKEPGVNRPLRSIDSKSDNLTRADYRNQVNKVANAVKEIVFAIVNPASLNDVPPVVLTAETGVPRNSIVVLPFVNMSNDPEQEYFSDGLTEEVITDLSNLRDLLVISRSSAMTFKGSKLKIRDIANEVHVRYALEGSVRKSGNSLRITVQLIDSLNDTHLWAEKYNGKVDDVFTIQENVSRAVVTALRLKLTPEEDHNIQRHAFDNVQAFECYLRAKAEMIKWNPTAINSALQLLQSGLEQVGPHPILNGGMAYAYWSFANLGIDAQINYSKAEEYVKKTFAADPESPEGYLVDGLLNQTRYGNPSASIRSFKKVLHIRPFDTHALTWLGLGFSICGKMESATVIANRLRSVDPLSSISRAMPTIICFYSGQFESSSDSIFNIYVSEPENSFWKYFTAICYIFEEKHEKALAFIEEHVTPGDDTIIKLTLALKYVLKGEPDHVLNILRDPAVLEVARIDCQYSQFISSICAQVGLEKESLEWLDNAIRRGFTNYLYIRDGDPSYRPLRTSPRFQSLVKQANQDWNKVEDL